MKFGSRFLITAAVGADPDLVGTAYNVPAMNQYMDFINLMTYDFNGPYNGVTGQNAPLYASSKETNKRFNSDYAITHWLRNGANPQKIIMGLGFYAKTFTLRDPNVNGLLAPTIGTGSPSGRNYREICNELNRGGWTVVYDYEQESPYAFKDDQWWGYDNPQSIRAKCNYAVSKNLGGVMMWSMDYDDVNNTCGTGWSPLFKAIWSVVWF